MCCLFVVVGRNGCNSLVERCALGVQLLGQLGNLAQQTCLHAAGNACCFLGIDGACQLVFKCDARRSDLLAYHIAHGHSLDVQDLVVLLKLGLHTGIDLRRGVNIVLCEQVEVLLVNVVRECICRALEVEQAALLRLNNPGLVVAVAVEDDALVRLDLALNECVYSSLEVLSALQLVSKLAELLGNCGIQHNICTRDVDGRTQRTELELVAGESKRRSTVAVGGVLRDRRKNSSAQIHLGLVNVGVILAGLDGIQNSLQLVADEHGDDSRRRLVRAQAVIVACGCNRDAEQILILVNSLDNSGQEQDELGVLARVLARLEQVLAPIGGNGPVVVLAGAVYALERLLMQQAGEAMLLRDGTHDLHGQLVVVGRDVGGGEHRRHLVLARCNLVVLGLGEDAQLHYIKELSQPGQYLCQERLTVKGPKGEYKNMAILGPFRKETQIELSLTDTRKIGLPGLIRQSGDTVGSPGCTLIGPKGELILDHGVIVAKRHIHMTPADAVTLKVKDNDEVFVLTKSFGRALIYADVVVRVDWSYRLAMHVDTDEANAFSNEKEPYGVIVKFFDDNYNTDKWIEDVLSGINR